MASAGARRNEAPDQPPHLDACGFYTDGIPRFSTRRPVSMAPLIPELNHTLHQATRFAIMSHLLKAGGGDQFPDVKRALGFKNASALSTHVTVLENAGYLKVRKSFKGRMTRTDLVMTARGQRAFEKHKEQLERMSEPSETAAPEAVA